MSRALVLLFFVGCSSPKADHATTPAASTQPLQPSQPSENAQLYAKGEQLEKEGRWEEAANAYQKYVFAMGDALTYIDRSSMELRIKQLREKAPTSRSAE